MNVRQQGRQTHADAVEQHSVERYLLGELLGDARERFEDHLFDCAVCTAELKDGLSFIEAARAELEASPVTFPVQAPVAADRKPSWFAWLWQPSLLAPALAACLAVVAYQSAVVLPEMRAELARNEQPAVVRPLVLANAGARGDSLPEIVAAANGGYLLSVDIPPSPGATAFRCTLYSEAGAALWHVDVPASDATDAVSIQVPGRMGVAPREGVRELRVAPITPATQTDDKLVPLASFRFRLSLAK